MFGVSLLQVYRKQSRSITFGTKKKTNCFVLISFTAVTPMIPNPVSANYKARANSIIKVDTEEGFPGRILSILEIKIWYPLDFEELNNHN